MYEFFYAKSWTYYSEVGNLAVVEVNLLVWHGLVVIVLLQTQVDEVAARVWVIDAIHQYRHSTSISPAERIRDTTGARSLEGHPDSGLPSKSWQQKALR